MHMTLKVRYNLVIILVIKLLFLLVFLTPAEVFSQKKQYVVVLDAGHGGKDPGNMGNGFREKNIALAVVKKVGAFLEKKKDIKVLYTRKNDTFIDLWKRGEIANKAKADLFVSIHCDSHTSNAYGAGTFVLGLRGNQKNFEIAKRENAAILLEDNYEKKYKGFDPNSAESVIGLSLLQEENLDKSLTIASLIQSSFTKQLKRKDRRVRQDNFQVLRETIMPSVLVELGFLTNLKEGRYLNSSKGQSQMANSIANAVIKFFNNIKANTIEGTTEVVKKKVENPKEEKKIQKKPVIYSVVYKVQIASSKKRIRVKSYNFKGLKNVERVKVGKYYKYYYGNSNQYQQTKEALLKAKKKGYKSAFIAAFKDGKKISVKEALKS